MIGAIVIPLPTEMILEVKKKVVKEIVDQFNENDNTGDLRNSIGWQVNEDKIYILRGMDVIAVI